MNCRYQYPAKMVVSVSHSAFSAESIPVKLVQLKVGACSEQLAINNAQP